eukprot:2768712-Prymnesium_polylepis.1
MVITWRLLFFVKNHLSAASRTLRRPLRNFVSPGSCAPPPRAPHKRAPGRTWVLWYRATTY